jgi:imidazolonepropionase
VKRICSPRAPLSRWFLRGGTTTIEAKSGYGLTLDAELKILRVIRQLGAEGSLRMAPTFLGAHEVPDEYRGRRSDYIRLLIEEMLPAVWREGLAESCDIFCEPSVFPAEEARGILQAARALGFRIRMHADQFSADEGSLLAAAVGADTADHLEATTERGWMRSPPRTCSRFCCRLPFIASAPAATRQRGR